MSLMLSDWLSYTVVRVNSRLQNVTVPSSLWFPPLDAPVPVGGGETGTRFPSTLIQMSTDAVYVWVSLPMFVIWLRMVHSALKLRTRSAGFDVFIRAVRMGTLVLGAWTLVRLFAA